MNKNSPQSLPVKVPTGLFNIGNTCFANSVLQWILHTPEMHQLLSKIKIGEDESEGEEGEGENESEGDSEYSEKYIKQPEFNNFDYNDDLPTYWCSLWGIKEMMEEMENSETNSFLPLGMKDIIKKVFGEEVRIGRQQDAHEFLMILLHTLEDSEWYKKAVTDMREEQLKIKTKKIPELNQIFEGVFTSNIQWQKWRRNNKNEQKFQDINLDIKDTFEDSMKYYFSSEKLEGDNKYDCRKCKQYTNAVKSLTLKDPPHNLIVNLKKFDINGAKIKAKIEYPYNFNLGDYIKPTGRRSRTKNSNMYELYAVINHEGYYSHWGHYNWYVKSFEDNWFRCDDSKVKKIGSQNQTSSEKAYILFYRLAKIPKKTTKRKVKVPIESESKEESKSLKSSTTKSSTVNRKRKKETKPAKSDSSKLPESKKRAGGKEKKTNWVMSEVVKSSGSCSKRFKKAEADNFDTSAEISI